MVLAIRGNQVLESGILVSCKMIAFVIYCFLALSTIAAGSCPLSLMPHRTTSIAIRLSHPILCGWLFSDFSSTFI